MQELTGPIWGAIAAAVAIQLALLAAWTLTRERKLCAGRALEARSERAQRAWIALGVAGGALAVAWLLRGLAQHSLPLAAELALATALVASVVVFALRAGSLLGEDRRYRDLFEGAPLGVVACDRTGQVRVVNARMWEMLGAPSALPASQLGNLLTHPAVVRGGGAELARRALETGATLASEASYDSLWRGTRILRVTAGPLEARSGEIAGAMLLAEDVTEGKAIQRHLRESERLAAMTRLAALIAHEVNDALACVQSNLTRVAEGLDARSSDGKEDSAAALDELKEVVGESAESVTRATSLMRDLQESARSDPAAEEAAPAPELRPLLRGCVRIATAHASYGQVIEEQYEDTPPLRGSSLLLRQALLNVIVNAVEAAGERGKVRVRTEHEAGFALVSVSDDGPGVAAEDAARIFEPFYSTKSEGAGAGLGLYLAREIVRAHHGEIRLLAGARTGATFEIRLPLANGAATHDGPSGA